MRLRPAALPLAAALGVGLPPLTAAPAAAASTSVVVSEVYGGGGNSGATFRNDFIELYNLGSTAVDLSGFSVAYFSASGGSGGSTPLSGTLQPGRHYLVQQSAGNGGSQDLPPPDATGSLSLAAGSGRVDLLQGSALVDRVGYGSASTREGAAAPAGSNTASVSRTPVTSDTDDNATDFRAGSPSPQNSGGTAGGGGGTPPPGSVTRISAIQGSGASSPLSGSDVTIEGIVTGVDDEIGASFGSGNTIRTFPGDAGLYVQEEAADSDGDPATSEGVFVGFVRDRGAYPAGTRVRVNGRVAEQFGQTVVNETRDQEPEKLDGGALAALPAPVTLDEGAATGQGSGRGYYESLEGMRVRLATGTALSGGTTKFGELFLVPGDQPRRALLRTDPPRPELIGTIDHAGAGDPANPFRNPVEADNAARVDADQFDLVRDVVGPLNFTFGFYKVAVQPGLSPSVEDTGVRYPYDRLSPAGPGQVRVASYNAENFFPAGGALDGGIVTQGEFEEKRNRLSQAIGGLLRAPDVVAVQEIGDNNHLGQSGGTSSQQTLKALADQLAADGFGSYAAFAEEGNDSRGIDVGFLVRSDVTVNSITQLGKDATESTTATCSDVPDGLFDRPPLAADVTTATQGSFVVISNHFASKGAPDACRNAQAEFVRDRVSELEAQGRQVLVTGDLNAFEDESPLAILDGPGTTLETQRDKGGVESNDAYSFLFNGVLQTLDHVLATAALDAAATDLVYAHINNDYADRFGARDGHRSADHDPLVLTLGPETPAPVVPDARTAVLLPLTGLAAAGVLVLRRRRAVAS